MGLVKKKIDLDEFIYKIPSKNKFISENEKKYLKNKKAITMCIDPNWMPFEKFEDGKHIGMTADYFKLFEERLDTEIRVLQTKNRSESIEFAKSRKCDILSLVMQTPKRDEYLNFTEPYLSVPLVKQKLMLHLSMISEH